jgi:hypothetical protein
MSEYYDPILESSYYWDPDYDGLYHGRIGRTCHKIMPIVKRKRKPYSPPPFSIRSNQLEKETKDKHTNAVIEKRNVRFDFEKYTRQCKRTEQLL